MRGIRGWLGRGDRPHHTGDAASGSQAIRAYDRLKHSALVWLKLKLKTLMDLAATKPEFFRYLKIIPSYKPRHARWSGSATGPQEPARTKAPGLGMRSVIRRRTPRA